MNFQTIVHDGFFNNPDKVREWGLTLDYQHPDGTYPGVRTRCTKFIHKKFYEATASKLISLWGVYDRHDWDLQLQFQKIKRFSDNPEMNVGWIHQDVETEAAAVIYLDPNADLNHGTSHYRTNSKFDTHTDYPHEKEAYTKVLGEKQSRDPEDLRCYLENVKYHNARFDRTLEVKNVYNRVIAYDGAQWHGQTSFHMDNDDDFRLTIVAFVTSISHPGTKRFSLKSRYI